MKFRHPVGSVSGYDLVATEIVDPYGQTTLLERDSQNRLWKITEPAGRYLQLNYLRYSYPVTMNNTTYTINVDVISKVDAYDGRGNLVETVSYHYDPPEQVGPNKYYNLLRVDYADNTQASYEYYGSSANKVPGRIKSCQDVRYAGAMSRILYEYATSADNGDPNVAGQIKREKNLTTGQMVSEVIYPSQNPYSNEPPEFVRTEKRGDGLQRKFQYSTDGNAELESYSDFKDQWSYIFYGAPSATYVKTLRDARGKETAITKNGTTGAILFVNYPGPSNTPGGANIRYLYSNMSMPYYVTERRDENGHTTFYDREPVNNRIWRTRYPDGGEEQFTYNGFGQIETHLMTSGGTETFEYYPDNRGLKWKHWAPVTESDANRPRNPTVYTYYGNEDGRPDRIDRLKTVTDPRGHITKYDYNMRGQVTRVTHHDGYYTQSEYKEDGTLKSTTDEWDHTTHYTCDEYKRVTVVRNHLNEETVNSYAPWNGAGSLSHTTSSVYWTQTQMGKITHYDYDENFRRYVMRQAPGTADDAWTWFSYDPVGNLETTTDPRGKVTTFGYDDRNRQRTITNVELNETTTVEYDDAGNKKKEIRPDGSFRRWEYNPMNRLRHTYGFLNEHTEYEPDPAGNVTRITDAKGAVYDFGFDDLNRKISETYPPDQYGVRRTETWQYDAAGNLELYKSPADQIKHFLSDERNRLKYAWWDGNVGNHVETKYDRASRVTDIITNWGETVISYGYDDANRKIWEDQTLAGHPTHRVQTDRDPDGNRRDLIVYTNGNADFGVLYDYTQRNQLWHIRGLDQSGLFTYTYDVAGNMTKRQGAILGNSTNAPSETYDAHNRPTIWEQTGAGDVPFARSRYQYDNLNREVATWRDEDNGLGSGRGERFDYDPTNQLKKVRYNATQVWTENPPNATRTVDYTYTPDTLNRQSVNDNGAVSDYGVSGMNQYTYLTGQGLHYDNNFNLWFLNGGYVYYDADKRVKSVWVNGEELLNCTYDGLGRVVRRTESGTAVLFAYDDWKQVTEYDDGNNLTNRNIYGAGPDEILMRGLYWWAFYHADKQGSVTALLDINGAILEKYIYDVFGQPTVTDGNGGNARGASWYGNRFMFTGREYLAWIACYDYRNRMYRPSLGRFLQTDPKGFDAADTNFFRYVGDNPVNNSDPLGLESAPARILPDKTWEIAKYMDGANTLQGTFQEQMYRRFLEMASVAEQMAASNTTRYQNSRGLYLQKVYHCNEFLGDAAELSGRVRPRVWEEGFPEGYWRNAVSREIADPKVKIPHWSGPRPVSEARRNDIIAQRHGRGGHSGIVTGPGRSITVDTRPQHGGRLIEDHWGFRSPPGNGEKPGDPPPVVRHYMAGSTGEW